MTKKTLLSFILGLGLCVARLSGAPPGDHQPHNRFQPAEVFELEYASDPQISPDGSWIVYVRNGFDILKDKGRSTLWQIAADGSDHRALTTGETEVRSPRWSPDGKRLLYLSVEDKVAQIRVRWMDNGQVTRLTHLNRSARGIVWSPDGKQIAFQQFVPAKPVSAVQMPEQPEKADWGPPIRYIERLKYRADGKGYLEEGNTHLFVVPAQGGTPRQVTRGAFDHGPPIWTADGKHLIFSANLHPDFEFQPLNSEIYTVAVSDGSIRALTDRNGPDTSPALSPDGSLLAYTGFDDRYQGYQVTRLYLMNPDGSGNRVWTGSLDRDVQNPVWDGQGKGVYFLYDEQGNTRIGYVSLDGNIETITENVGGLSLGRPYSGGAYSVAKDGLIAFTHSEPDHPAELAVVAANSAVRRLTSLNDDLLAHKTLASVEEIWFPSSYDQRQIQGWIVKPPDFQPGVKYPLMLEIHGGPFANYGSRFSTEIQLYAAAGYVVLYSNPRGSTGYGEEFGNLIHHAYPGHDFDDLMAGVDAVIAKGYIDEDNLFVTGGSGGGVLTAWIVTRTDRFRAAVSAKPVINWYSFVLTSDGPAFFYRYWFPGPPWENTEHYLRRSPISYVANVRTPTMLLTGEEDYRTPIEQSEQFYEALKIRKVPAAMVRIPDASHGIAAKPSNLVAKVQYILGWFEKHRKR